MASYASLGGGIVMVTNAGAPSNGTSGTGAGVAGPGSLLIDSTNANLYQNTNTKASPTWTQFSDLSGTLAFTDLDAGTATGTAGTIDVYPGTTTTGKLQLACAANAAAYTVGITNASHGQASTYTIPDSGAAAANFVITTGANWCKVATGAANRTVTLGGDLTTTGAVSMGTVTLGGTLTTAAAVTFSGAFAATIAVPSASTWTLPSGGGTLALATGAETGTTSSSYTVDSDSATGKLKLQVNSVGGTNHTVTLQAPTTTQDVTLTLPDAATDTVCVLAATQTLAAKTLTAPVINGATTAAAANNFTLHTGTGAFTTPTGTFTHYGNVANNGNITFDFSGSNGTFKTSTGANTLGGDVTIAAGKQLDIGTAAGGDATPLRLFSATAANGILVVKCQDDTDNNTTTLQSGNPGAAANPTITLPIATCTLPGLGLANSFTAAQTVSIDDASNNAVTDLAVLEHTTSGATAAGIGVGISFKAEDAGGSEEQASIDAVLATVTDGQEDCDLIFKANLNGDIQQVFAVDSVNQQFIVGQNVTDADGISKVTIYPVTASRGSLVLSAVAHASADRSTTIQTATDSGAAVVLTLPNTTGTIPCSATDNTFSGAQTFTGGAATPAVVMRFGDTATEGLEVKVYDETIELTNAVATDTTLALPAGAVILSAQVNLQAAITGDGTGDNLFASIGLGVSGGDEDAYGDTANLNQNTKIDTIPAWSALAGATTLAIFALQADRNTACTEKFTGGAGQNVRVRVVYLACNSLDNA